MGHKVELSADGNTVFAVANSSANYYKKHVRAYRYTPSGVTSWTQLGNNSDMDEHYLIQIILEKFLYHLMEIE